MLTVTVYPRLERAMLSTGFRVQSAGFRVRVQGAGFRVQGQGSGCKVQGSGSGFRVQGSTVTVYSRPERAMLTAGGFTERFCSTWNAAVARA